MEELERLIREMRPQTAAGRVIPPKAPDGWVHLSVATARIAQALLKDDESGVVEAFGFCLGLDRPDETGDEGLDQYRRDLAILITDFIVRSCYQGHLITGYRRIGGGSEPVRLIDREWWNGLEDSFAPFRTWGIDPNDGSSADPPNWIWVKESSLITQEARLAHLGDPEKALPCVDFGDGGSFEAIPLFKAISIVETVSPSNSGARFVVGSFVQLCASGAVKTLAGHMYRSLNANESGQNGQVVEAVPTWPIPIRLWALVADSPLQDWRRGEIVVQDGPDAYHLKNVHADRATLMKALERAGLVDQVYGPGAGAWAMLLNDASWIGYAPKNGRDRFRTMRAEAEEADGSMNAHAPDDEVSVLEADPVIPTDGSWQRQTKETPERRLLLNILRNAHDKEMLQGQASHRSQEWLHERYKDYCARHKDKDGNPAPVKPLGLSAAKKWMTRYRKGKWGGRPTG